MNENKLKAVRQQYSPQFKGQALERAAKEGVARVAKEPGVKESLIYYWRKQKSLSGTPIEKSKIAAS